MYPSRISPASYQEENIEDNSPRNTPGTPSHTQEQKDDTCNMFFSYPTYPKDEDIFGKMAMYELAPQNLNFLWKDLVSSFELEQYYLHTYLSVLISWWFCIFFILLGWMDWF